MKNIQTGNPYQLLFLGESGDPFYIEIHGLHLVIGQVCHDLTARAFIGSAGIELAGEEGWPCLDDALSALALTQAAKEIGWNAPQLLGI